MPELPEVESVVRSLRPNIIGKTISQVDVFDSRLLENSRLADLQVVLVGQKFSQIQRRGKFILFILSNGYQLTAHLRMTGNYLFYHGQQPAGKHTRMVISFADGGQIHYQDMRRFGQLSLFSPESKIEKLEKLGPEPLSSDYTPQYLKNKIGQLKAPIKQLLLDQTIIAGIGNIYASEILFDALISPFKPANAINPAEYNRLVQSTRKILEKAILCQGSTISDYQTPEGKNGNFQECFQVYGRENEPCYKCSQPVKRVAQAQRSTFYCPACQEFTL